MATPSAVGTDHITEKVRVMPVHLTRGSARLRARSNRVGIGDGEGNGLCEFIFGGVLTHLIGLRGQYALHDL